MKLVFIGIQGSGKGTQAKILADRFGFSIFETGLALRTIAKENTKIGLEIKNLIDFGKQVPSELVEEILIDHVAETKGNIIFDGLVRNHGNKMSADKILHNNYTVIFFELDRQEAENRLLGRMYNSKTGNTFPYGIKIDPETGDKLTHRADDNTDAIKVRIEEFYTKTVPIIEEYEKENRKIIKIDASKSVEDVTNELIEKLNLK